MAESTWESRELRLLEAVAEGERAPGMYEVDISWLCRRTELDPRDAMLGTRALYDAKFIDGIDVTAFGEEFDLTAIRLLEKGRRAIQQWPSEDAFATALAILERRMSEESDPERRARYKKLRDAMIDVGKGVAGSVLSAVIRDVARIP